MLLVISDQCQHFSDFCFRNKKERSEIAAAPKAAQAAQAEKAKQINEQKGKETEENEITGDGMYLIVSER